MLYNKRETSLTIVPHTKTQLMVKYGRRREDKDGKRKSGEETDCYRASPG